MIRFENLTKIFSLEGRRKTVADNICATVLRRPSREKILVRFSNRSMPFRGGRVP